MSRRMQPQTLTLYPFPHVKGSVQDFVHEHVLEKHEQVKKSFMFMNGDGPFNIHEVNEYVSILESFTEALKIVLIYQQHPPL